MAQPIDLNCRSVDVAFCYVNPCHPWFMARMVFACSDSGGVVLIIVIHIHLLQFKFHGKPLFSTTKKIQQKN
jgi:hypothetical protein